MSTEWSVEEGGLLYSVSFEKGKIFVNGEKIKLKRAAGSNVVQTGYEVPLGDTMATLWLPKKRGNDPILTINGKDVKTGEEYEILKAPGWIYTFLALYIFNFLFLLGGALGGALNFVLYGWTYTLAANNKKSTAARVFTCIGIYVAAAVVELILAIAITGALSR